MNVDATSSRHIDVNTTSFWHQMPAGLSLTKMKKVVGVYHSIIIGIISGIKELNFGTGLKK